MDIQFSSLIRIFYKIFGGVRKRLSFLTLFVKLKFSNRKALAAADFFILPHMGYGDQIICLPIYKFLADNGKRFSVIAQGGHIRFLSQVLSSEHVNFVPIESAFAETLPLNIPVSEQALIFSRTQKRPLLVLGYELLDVRSFLRPEVDFNTLFYEFARVPIECRGNLHLSLRLAQLGSKHPIPDVPYALVDHFPGTIREIPSSVLLEIENRGLKIVLNPREIPYEELSDLIENAAELHYVNSSLFCLSMFLELKAISKNVYLMREGLYHGLGFYDESWQEWILNDRDLHPFLVPYKFDSNEHAILMRKKASQFWRMTFDRLLFGGRIN